MTFPIWNGAGVIPALRPGLAGHHTDRSPYSSTLVDFVDYFCFSAERIEIARGLLQYRERLHTAGLTSGFQWLNGSFSEHVEVSQSRSPNDVDVVTFFELAAGTNTAAIAQSDPDLFNNTWVKNSFKVDSYYFQLGLPQGASEIQRVSYWYSMWSHRRDGLWKGFIQIDLNPAEDAAVSIKLDAIEANMGNP